MTGRMVDLYPKNEQLSMERASFSFSVIPIKSVSVVPN
jgi:hypothetical protein